MKHTNKIEKYQAYQEFHSRVTIPNMHYKDNAPMFISIIGPQRSGKSALFTGLIEQCTEKTVIPLGPVTFKNRFRRLSIYEPTNEIESVIDSIKVSDLILLTINVEAGLEKETLEAINMINSHGLTKLIVVLTQPLSKRVSATNIEQITKRVSQEFSFPIKFYDLKKDGFDKIRRAIELIKCKPLDWKCTHPHIVVDRYKDGCAYGYIRGGPLRRNSEAHVPGQGNFVLEDIEILEDPCSLKQKGVCLYDPADGNLCGKNREASQSLPEDVECGASCSNIILYKENGICKEGTGIISRLEDGRCQRVASYEEKSIEIDTIKKRISGKFKKEPETEEDYVKKFNEEYNEKEKDELNFLQKDKLREMEIKEELDECPDLLIPGQYCKVRINIVYNPRNITIIGVCLLSENENIHLQGKVIKNKWQKGDLKTNTPQFISVGWWRFQTIPLFSQDDRVQKYLRSSMAPLYGEIAFYGPSVAVGTSFFIYSYTGKYRILASGRILNTSGIVTVKKKLKLLGYPKTTTGNTAIIQSMFSSEKEVSKFTGAKLACASGLRGILKTATGHGGDFRATFEGSLLLSDTVFIKCYVPVKPYSYVCHTGEGVTYLRSMKEIKESQGIPLYEESASESFERIVEPAVKGRSGDRGDLTRQRRICELEQKLPFKMRAPVVIKESIDLPISPDQRAMTVKKEEILQMRKILDEEEENVRRRACDLARKKKLEAIEEKLVRKRKLALEGKQNFENAYKKNKKAHKKSKRKKK